MEDNNIKALLLGQVTRVPADNTDPLDKEKIKEVLQDGADIASFCEGCGFVQGWFKDQAEELATDLKIQLPKSLTNYFIESQSCNLCSDNFTEVEIKKY